MKRTSRFIALVALANACAVSLLNLLGAQQFASPRRQSGASCRLIARPVRLFYAARMERHADYRQRRHQPWPIRSHFCAAPDDSEGVRILIDHLAFSAVGDEFQLPFNRLCADMAPLNPDKGTGIVWSMFVLTPMPTVSNSPHHPSSNALP